MSVTGRDGLSYTRSACHGKVTQPVQTILRETGISRAYLENILKNPFYIGRFAWQGIEYKGTHDPLVSPELFQRVQDTFGARNKPKYRKHNFALAGLLTCAHDGCTITTELQKGKYVYYRCSHGRGKCPLPYMCEQEVPDRLGELLKQIYVPEAIARTIVDSLQADLNCSEARRQEQISGLVRANRKSHGLAQTRGPCNPFQGAVVPCPSEELFFPTAVEKPRGAMMLWRSLRG